MLALTACGSEAEPSTAWSFEQQIGLVTNGCLSIRNASLRPGSALRMVNPMAPQHATDGRIEGPDQACAKAGTFGYRVTKRAGSVPTIGIVGYSGPFHQVGGVVSADLDRDGKSEHFRSCTSSEGVHFTVWTGKPLSGQLRWHEYHYLGYDVEPDCRPEEITPLK